MFGFAEWDSWLSFILEASLSVAVIIGLFFVVRRVNASSEADRQRYLLSKSTPPASDDNTEIQDASVFSEESNDTREAAN